MSNKGGYVMCNSSWDCITCLNWKVWQNSKYSLASDKILFLSFTMFLFFSLNIVQFLDMSIFESHSIYHFAFNILFAFKLSDNMFKNLNWSGGLCITATVIGLCFSIRRYVLYYCNKFYYILYFPSCFGHV